MDTFEIKSRKREQKQEREFKYPCDGYHWICAPYDCHDSPGMSQDPRKHQLPLRHKYLQANGIEWTAVANAAAQSVEGS